MSVNGTKCIALIIGSDPDPVKRTGSGSGRKVGRKLYFFFSQEITRTPRHCAHCAKLRIKNLEMMQMSRKTQREVQGRAESFSVGCFLWKLLLWLFVCFCTRVRPPSSQCPTPTRSPSPLTDTITVHPSLWPRGYTTCSAPTSRSKQILSKWVNNVLKFMCLIRTHLTSLSTYERRTFSCDKRSFLRTSCCTHNILW